MRTMDGRTRAFRYAGARERRLFRTGAASSRSFYRPHQDALAEAAPKQMQDRFVSTAEGDIATQAAKSTKTAEAVVPTSAAAAPAK